MTEIYLIRHGATAGNLQRRYVGRTDEALCPQGRAQIAALRGTLPPPDLLFSSPLRRARETAALLFPERTPVILPDLRETDFGDFEGHTADELSHSPAYRAWVDGNCAGPVPGGESAADVRARVLPAFLNAAKGLPPDARAAFVLHGGGIMTIMESLGDPPRSFYGWRLPNGGYYVCRWDGCTLKIN